jgi:soluble calcium-activated nucleotidase 1
MNTHMYVLTGKLLSFDDRSGIAYEISEAFKAIPRYILMEGDGETAKGQKTEWATVKDGKLYVGSFGKEYVNKNGEVVSRNNLWVNVVDESGGITHEDWTAKYEVVREAAGAQAPGYMVHEAILFDDLNREWLVMPRRISSDPYDEKLDERKGANMLFILDENFTKVKKKVTVGPQVSVLN